VAIVKRPSSKSSSGKTPTKPPRVSKDSGSSAKPTGRPRTRSRVEKAEGNSRESDGYKISGSSTEHKKSEPAIDGMARLLDSGEILISSQLSEVVPVGRFAGITIGPAQLAWKLSGVDMSVLADVDWSSDDPLTIEQQVVYDRVRGSMVSTSKILQHVIDDDREVIDEAVKRFNAAELEEEKGNKPRRK